MAEVRGSSPLSSTPSELCDSREATTVGAHEFRNRFGWYLERAAAGETIHVTRRGRPHVELRPSLRQLELAEAPPVARTEANDAAEAA
jgi:prevent-host-death family protein